MVGKTQGRELFRGSSSKWVDKTKSIRWIEYKHERMYLKRKERNAVIDSVGGVWEGENRVRKPQDSSYDHCGIQSNNEPWRPELKVISIGRVSEWVWVM